MRLPSVFSAALVRFLRVHVLIPVVLLAGCGHEAASMCPVGNGFVRKSVVSLRNVETRLMRGNTVFVLGEADETYPVIQASASAQAALDAAFVEMSHKSIDVGDAVADIEGAVVICIPSGDLGLKLDTLAVSRIRQLNDAEMDAIIVRRIAAQHHRSRRQRLLSAGMRSN